MSVNATTAVPDIAELEERFLTGLSERPLNVDTLLGVLRYVHKAGEVARADEWALLLQEALIEVGDGQGMLRLLRLQVSWHKADNAFGALAGDALRKAFKTRETDSFITSSEFGALPPAESVRRFVTLLSCKPGTLCLEKTWGFGVIQRVDDFYKKITIDFDRKRNHQLTFAYAADVLQLVADDHLLARYHRDRDGIEALIRKNPAEIVKLALQSFGPMSVVKLQRIVTDELVDESQWKSFWDGARKGLKSDPLVEIPSKRNDPIRMLATACSYGDEWFEMLAVERAPETILKSLTDFETDGAKWPSAEAKDTAAERLRFALRGTDTSNPALYTRLGLLADRLALEGVDIEQVRQHMARITHLCRASERLPVRDIGRMVAFVLATGDNSALCQEILRALPQMPFALVNEVLDLLPREGELEATQVACRRLLQSREAPVALVAWACRHGKAHGEWGVVSGAELMMQCVLWIEQSVGADALKCQNMIVRCFESPKWMGEMLKELSAGERRALFERVQAASGWDSTAQRSLMGRMIKLYPELAKQAAAAEPVQEVRRMRLTSWHSYQERVRQFKKLVEVDIPANSRDIAVARSYGDLRENFEYQAAKDQQRLLLRRQGEMEAGFEAVKGTDFVGLSSEVAGMGTCVVLRRDGREPVTYTVLGEWDRDEALGIVSSHSGLARALEGHGAGETVTVPGELGEETAVIDSVGPLSDEVRAWIGSPPKG